MPGPHVQYARYVVQWNVIAGGGTERSNFEYWLTDVSSMGLTPDVALTSYNGVYPSSSTEYKSHLKELLAQATAMGHPVRYLEAWNEPNNQGKETAVNAAHFTNSAYSACEEGYGCTIIAGNVEDSSGAKAYEEEYRKNLSPVPSIWGLHPYYSVEYKSESYYTKAVEGMPNAGGGDQIWITEVAARKCTDYNGNLEEHGEAGQAERAKWLVNNLIATRKPEHVFYYEFLLGERRQPLCSSSEPEDDALYLPSSDPNAPDAPRPAASFIFGGKGVPSAYTGTTSISTTEPVATVAGSVYPGGSLDAKYHFEYGTTTSYGAYSSEGDAGSGLGEASVSINIGGLSGNTTYHYRLVSWNAEGTETLSYGEDHTFTTPSPPTVTTSSASSIKETKGTLNGTVNPNGADTHYYFEYGTTTGYGHAVPAPPGLDLGSGRNTLLESEVIGGLQPGTTYHYRIFAKNWAGESYGGDSQFTTLYEEFSSRWAVREAESNHQYVFYRRGGNGELWESWEPGTGWGAKELGLQMAPGTTPAVVRDAKTSHPYVFYQGQNGALWETYEPGTGWSAKELGPQMAPGTSPTAILDPSTGHIFLCFIVEQMVHWERLTNLGAVGALKNSGFRSLQIQAPL